MSDTLKVTLAYPLEHEGKIHKADSTVALPRELAKNLLWNGKARLPAKSSSKPAPETPAAPAEDTTATTATAQKEK